MDLAPLVDDLRLKHAIHALVLYGSHARGDATSESDIDVAGFADVESVLRDARTWNGVFLDGFVYPTNITPDVDLLKLRGGKVLLDERGIVPSLFQTLDEIEAKGPPKLRQDEIDMRVVWMRKMLARIRRGDIEANYRRHWLLYQMLEDYFALRNRWYRGPKLALAGLAKDAPQVFQAFERALAPNAPIEAIDALVGCVIVE